MKKYYKENKVSILWFLIGLLVILVTSIVQTAVQSSGGSVLVSDLRNATNTGTVSQTIQYTDETGGYGTIETELEGEVVSGILYVPKTASEENPAPAIVLTHGYLNAREHQLPNAIELARRGFVVLTIDREGHGNYNNITNSNALMTTTGLYDSAKYLYNLPYVDQTRVGMSGHSMGGYSTMMSLYQDSLIYTVSTGTDSDGRTYNALGYGILSAGLIQGWSTFVYANPDVDVGILKATDDEFFFNSQDADGNATISRQYLQSQAAATFVGVSWTAGTAINIQNCTPYVNGEPVEYELGVEISSPFRAIYEADEIHPLNHWSTASTSNVIDFFYAAFGTPSGHSAIAGGNQIWVIKEIASFIGMLALLSLIIPGVGLFLTIPFFKSLKVRTKKVIREDGVLAIERAEVTPQILEDEVRPLKKWYEHLFVWIPAIFLTLWGGFSIRMWVTDLGDRWFPNTQLFPQDTTNWLSMWTMVCGIVCGLVLLAVYLIRYGINVALVKKNKEPIANDNPFKTATIFSLGNAIKTIILAALVVFGFYLIVFLNWNIFVVDFRLWTLNFKVFNVPEMLPTMLRYLPFFLVYYIISGIANQTYRFKNIPEWATIAINAFFNVFGIFLVIMIQYGTFKSTGVLWQSDMALGYIVVFPVVAVLIFATIISRLLYKKTGNIWLGSLINGLLFTIMTVAGTAASYAYVLG